YSVIRDPQDMGDKPDARELKISSGEIVFDNVSFHYGEKKLFENKHVQICGGERVGLVGYTGAGKSTFINLILRFFPLHNGKILIDGHEVANITLESLRRQVALIPQDPVLFHRTLRENISYGKPEATEAEITRAAQLAHCDEFIRNIPNGYEENSDNRTTFETEKTAHTLFKGCRYVLHAFEASSYSQKNSVEQKYSLITEHCDGCANKEFLDQLPPKERWEFFLNILEGVQAIHDRGYCHFDLKSGNILYKKVNGRYEPRIIDFGVMHQMGKILEYGSEARGGCRPPENKLHENFPFKVTDKVDIWSLGDYAARHLLNVEPEQKVECILNEKNAYLGKKHKDITNWATIPPGTEEFAAIIQQMLALNPAERISITSASEQIREKIAAHSSLSDYFLSI
ncbi:MAG TPA: ATP-binding cassette domain-containing protein, partial [Waddliaceae bacterium]